MVIHVTCPNCSSSNVARRHRTLWDRLISWLSGRYPFVCEQCGHEFRTRYKLPPPSSILDD